MLGIAFVKPFGLGFEELMTLSVDFTSHLSIKLDLRHVCAVSPTLGLSVDQCPAPFTSRSRSIKWHIMSSARPMSPDASSYGDGARSPMPSSLAQLMSIARHHLHVMIHG